MLHPWSRSSIAHLCLGQCRGSFGRHGHLNVAGPSRAGVAGGLFFGKLIGVFGATFLAVKLGIGQLPRGVGWTKIAAVSMLAGIGFTMAMFVAGLAYESPTTLDTAKLGVLIGSTVSGVIGFLVLRSAANFHHRFGRLRKRNWLSPPLDQSGSASTLRRLFHRRAGLFLD